MENTKPSIFRKQALDRVSSPEELDHYLVVTKPGIWFVLIAIIVLIIGALVWASVGNLRSTAQVAVVSEDGQVRCLVKQDYVRDVLAGGKVTIAGTDYELSDTGLAPQIVSSFEDQDVLYAGGLQINDVVQPLTVNARLPEGIYQGEVVISVVKPISFITN